MVMVSQCSLCGTLFQEMGLSRDESFVSMFTDIHSIAQSLRTHCVESALE